MEMDAPKPTRGRPKIDPERRKRQRSFRMESELWALVDRYGNDWVRELIRHGAPPKDFVPPEPAARN